MQLVARKLSTATECELAIGTQINYQRIYKIQLTVVF